MNELSSARTNAFSDIAVDKTGIRGVVSFGTLFKTIVSYVYGMEMYGTDEESIRKHIFRHASVLKRLGTGSACMMFFIQENIEKFGKVSNDICNRLSMKHVIYTDRVYPYWNFQNIFLYEKEFGNLNK